MHIYAAHQHAYKTYCRLLINRLPDTTLHTAQPTWGSPELPAQKHMPRTIPLAHDTARNSRFTSGTVTIGPVAHVEATEMTSREIASVRGD